MAISAFDELFWDANKKSFVAYFSQNAAFCNQVHYGSYYQVAIVVVFGRLVSWSSYFFKLEAGHAFAEIASKLHVHVQNVL